MAFFHRPPFQKFVCGSFKNRFEEYERERREMTADFIAEHGREPSDGFHSCPEWDYMLIDKKMPEYEACICFQEDLQ